MERRGSLLLVEDEDVLRMLVGQFLRGEGFEVSEAANGLEALELALLSRFDLMVVDVNMPQMDGYTLVSRLRAADVGISCPVVMISTESQDSDVSTASSAGANLFLTKPVAPALLTRVARVLTGPLPDLWPAAHDVIGATA